MRPAPCHPTAITPRLAARCQGASCLICNTVCDIHSQIAVIVSLMHVPLILGPLIVLSNVLLQSITHLTPSLRFSLSLVLELNLPLFHSTGWPRFHSFIFTETIVHTRFVPSSASIPPLRAAFHLNKSLVYAARKEDLLQSRSHRVKPSPQPPDQSHKTTTIVQRHYPIIADTSKRRETSSALAAIYMTPALRRRHLNRGLAKTARSLVAPSGGQRGVNLHRNSQSGI